MDISNLDCNDVLNVYSRVYDFVRRVLKCKLLFLFTHPKITRKGLVASSPLSHGRSWLANALLSCVVSLALQRRTSPFSAVHGPSEIDLGPSNEALVSNYGFNLPYNCSNILPLKSNTEEDKPMEISA